MSMRMDCWSSSRWNATLSDCMSRFTPNRKVDNAIICGTKECMDLFVEYRKQYELKCISALFDWRDGKPHFYNPYLCDESWVTPAPTSSIPSAPATLVPSVADLPGVNATEPVIARPTQVVPRPPPSKAAVDESSGNAAAYSVAGVIAVVAVIGFVLFVRRHSRNRSNNSKSSTHSPTCERGEKQTEYSEFSSPRAPLNAAPTDTSASQSLWTHSSITTNRIPLEKVHVGPCISQGGYGEVCIGTYKNAHVAIKRLLPMRRKDPESIASFLSEIQLTSTLDHECIVTFIGVAWDAPSDLCMVSEFISGGDMRSYLGGRASNSQGFDDDKLRIAVCVAHALTYLHSLQPVVVHRDLKSRNILLTQKPELHAKLMDFGVSCDRRDTTMTAGVGTSLWMAPEVMLGERYNEKADVFSFGVVLSELDTHELPYAQAKDPNSDRRMSEMVLMQRVVSGSLKPSFSSKADTELVALADECLQLDPNLRPSAAVVLYRLHKNRLNDTLV